MRHRDMLKLSGTLACTGDVTADQSRYVVPDISAIIAMQWCQQIAAA
jgi:hypothetical protein